MLLSDFQGALTIVAIVFFLLIGLPWLTNTVISLLSRFSRIVADEGGNDD